MPLSVSAERTQWCLAFRSSSPLFYNIFLILDNYFIQQLFVMSLEDVSDSTYFDSLCSMGLEKLGREKPRLDELRSALDTNLQVLPVSNYAVFLKSGESVKTVVDELLSSENLVDNILSTTEDLRKQMDLLQGESQNIQSRLVINGQSVEHHSRLLEVLEIPQLMDTYIRNGYYDEALELLNVVTRMERRHSGSLPLVMQIANDVAKLVDSFHATLLQQLNGNIQLPQCLRVIGCLRRLGRDSELALRVKFLLARDSWLQSQLSSVYNFKDVPKRLSKFTETTRTCLFDIVTQYRAVFSDDEFRQSAQTPHSSDFSSTLVFGKILPGWLLVKIDDYLRVLESQISANEETIFSSLDSVVNQAMYFGLSFSRIGCDFRPRLVPIFESVTLRRFRSLLDSAVNSFERCSDIPALMTIDNSKYEATATSGGSDHVSPPSSLLAYPILAKFSNGLVSAFSLLLLFCPLSIEQKVYDSLSESLSECYAVLQQSGGYESSQQFIDAFLQQVVPFAEDLMNFCFRTKVKFNISGVNNNTAGGNSNTAYSN